MYDEPIPTPLPLTTSPSHPPTTVIDAQALQNYLSELQSNISNQLRSVNERLDAVTNAPHHVVSSSQHDPSSSPPVPSHSPPSIPSSHPMVSVNRESSASITLRKLLSKPSHFHGEHGNRVYDWLSELDITFDNIGTATEHQKITFARQCLRDEALRWWIAREQEVVHSRQRIVLAQLGGHDSEKNDVHQTKEITSWSEFKQVFVDYFCPRGASEAARNQLHSLRQSQFRNLASYCDRFETVARRITTTPGHDITEELIATFKVGLSDGRIRLHLTTGHPSSLFEATRQAMQAESDLNVSNIGVRDNHGRTQYNGTNRFHNVSRHIPRTNGSWNHGSSLHRYSSAPNSFHQRTSAPSPMNSNRDTSVPMELGIVDADEEEPWEVDLSSPSDSANNEETPLDPTLSTEDDRTSVGYTSGPGEDRDQQVNFVTRERRPSDRPWRSNRSGEYDRSRVSNSGSMKQQLAQKNNCWNCGKIGHFLIDCPYQKVNSADSLSSSTTSKPPAPKKF